MKRYSHWRRIKPYTIRERLDYSIKASARDRERSLERECFWRDKYLDRQRLGESEIKWGSFFVGIVAGATIMGILGSLLGWSLT